MMKTNRPTFAQWFCLTAVALCVVACAQDKVPSNIVGSNFVLPIMKDGEKSMLVRGKAIKSFESFINLDGLQIQLYPTKDMDATVLIFSPQASYNVKKQSAASKERVNMRALHPVNDLKKDQVQYQTVIDGTGFDFVNGTRTLAFRSKVVARMRPVTEQKGGDADHSTIAAKRLDYAFAKQPGTITFQGEVDGIFSNTRKAGKTGKAVADEFHLKAETLVIRQGDKRSIDTFDATGDVRIAQRTGNKMVATGDKAVCTFGEREAKPAKGGKPVKLKTRIIRLTGDPTLTTPQGKLTGANEIVIKKIGEQAVEALTIGGRPVMVLLTDADMKLLPELSGSKKSGDPKKTPGANSEKPKKGQVKPSDKTPPEPAMEEIP